jgi:putative transposase
VARLARVMLAMWPFHVVHRGNHQQLLFATDEDHRTYLRMLRRYSAQFSMRVWAYCLMPNHVHLIVVGRFRNSIPRAVGNTHRHFSRCANSRTETTGHLWANRFYSTILDESHLWAAVRYVELNPVRAGFVQAATDYEWSSTRAHAGKFRDPVLDPERPFPGAVADWSAWISDELEAETIKRIRRNTATGRPTGRSEFVAELERLLGRPLRARKRGPTPKSRDK